MLCPVNWQKKKKAKEENKNDNNVKKDEVKKGVAFYLHL